MGKHKAIPQGYMTVGDIAKKAGVTVRTIQYYDKIGVLSPSSASEGRFRLYSHKDFFKLFLIQTMKKLGLSLDEIKTRIPSIDTKEQLLGVLDRHAEETRTKIESLKNYLENIEELQTQQAIHAEGE